MALQNQQHEVEVVKSGETCIQLVYWRSKLGVSFTVKVQPAIEDLMRSWGSGQQQDVNAYGRYWTSPVKDQIMKVWNMSINPGIVPVNPQLSYRLDQVGAPLIIVPDEGSRHPVEIVNLSFMRLVGASEGEGVSFSVKAVAWSPQEAKRACALIQQAAAQFYISYLKPMKVVIRVTTEEVRG